LSGKSSFLPNRPVLGRSLFPNPAFHAKSSTPPKGCMVTKGGLDDRIVGSFLGLPPPLFPMLFCYSSHNRPFWSCTSFLSLFDAAAPPIACYFSTEAQSPFFAFLVDRARVDLFTVFGGPLPPPWFSFENPWCFLCSPVLLKKPLFPSSL